MANSNVENSHQAAKSKDLGAQLNDQECNKDII